MYKHMVSVLAIIVFSLVARSATLVDLEDKPLSPNAFYNGADNAHGFTSRGAHFNNAYSDFGGGVTSWEGWSYSNVVNPTTAGFGNQYAAYPGGGSSANGSVSPGGTYAVADAGFSIAPIIDLP